MNEPPKTFPLTRELLLDGVTCIQSEYVVGAKESEELNQQYEAALAELDAMVADESSTHP